jgi:hypothetical protein
MSEITILCLASYCKGTSFITAAKHAGAKVLLVAKEKLRDEAWPWKDIHETMWMPSVTKRPDIIYGVSYLMRFHDIRQVIPLDDYDVETAAMLREHLRLPGLGETTARFFRDKLAMRIQARRAGLAVPPFTPVFNHARLARFMDDHAPPWVLKPRSEAGAMGIKKVNSSEEVWSWLERLGDEQSFFLLEQFLSGEVYHVDALTWGGEVQLAIPHKYARPPMTVAHHGGVFVTRTLRRESEESRQVLEMNSRLLGAFGLPHGASHAEFIRDADGNLNFLEVAARVGGANIEQLVAAASGVNLWAEWARMEIALAQDEPYHAPDDAGNFAGVLICLSRQPHPDLSAYQAPEIVYRLDKEFHAGLVLATPEQGRLEELLNEYAESFAQDFLAVAPPLDKPPD